MLDFEKCGLARGDTRRRASRMSMVVDAPVALDGSESSAAAPAGSAAEQRRRSSAMCVTAKGKPSVKESELVKVCVCECVCACACACARVMSRANSCLYGLYI